MTVNYFWRWGFLLFPFGAMLQFLVLRDYESLIIGFEPEQPPWQLSLKQLILFHFVYAFVLMVYIIPDKANEFALWAFIAYGVAVFGWLLWHRWRKANPIPPPSDTPS